MSGRVYAIEYKHTADGKNYRHDFGSGIDMVARRDGKIVISGDGKRVWEDFDDMKFLVNPAKKKRAAKRTTKRRSTRTTKRKVSASTRRRSAASTGAKSMAAKRRRRKTVRRNPPRASVKRRRRTYRRNPPLSSLPKLLISGVESAAFGIAGKIGARFIRTQLGFVPSSMMGNLAEVGAGVAAALLLGNKWGDASRAIMQGAMMAPLESMIKTANIPVVTDLLGNNEYALAIPMSGYPGGMHGYPQLMSGYADLAIRAPYGSGGMDAPHDTGMDGYPGDEMGDFAERAKTYGW